MDVNGEYEHLKPKQGSRYRQLFVDGRIMAEVLYRETVGLEHLTPEEVACQYSVPVEAVREAIHYCEHNSDILEADRARESAHVQEDGRERWPYAPRDYQPHA